MSDLTPAEAAFKRAVNELIDAGIYPSGAKVLRRVGRVGRNLNGREMRWRETVLVRRGFTYDDKMWMYRWRRSDWRPGPVK